MIKGTTTARFTELLHYAAANCDRDIILKILQRGADIMAEDSRHRLPLEMAIDYKNSKWDVFCKSNIYFVVEPVQCAGARAALFFLLSLELPTAYKLTYIVCKQNHMLVSKNKTKK
jgi:hypothetical protein